MPELYLEQKPEVKNTGKIIGRIKLAASLTEPTSLPKIIEETEKDPLFQQLFFERVIRYRRFRNSGFASSFEQIQEFNLRDTHPLDLQSFLEGKENVIKKIRALGKEKFKKYLYEGEFSSGERDGDGKVDEEIKEFILDLSIAKQFSSIPESPHHIHYSKIAKIEKANKEFRIFYFSLHQGRGRYSIDYERLKEIEETIGKKRLKRLIKNLEIINNQKLLFHSILENIVKYQKPYLKSGNYEDLNPLTQRKLAGDIKVNPSSVSRAIRYRTVETPFGEIPLKRFFVKESEIRKRLLKQIIVKEEKRCSDRELKEEFSLPFSRRTIAHYRKILTLPSSFKRYKIYPSGNFE